MALSCQNYHFLYEYYVAKFKVCQYYWDTRILSRKLSKLASNLLDSNIFIMDSVNRCLRTLLARSAAKHFCPREYKYWVVWKNCLPTISTSPGVELQF